MSHWIQLTHFQEKVPVYVNMGGAFAIMPAQSGATRVWSGSTAAIAVPATERGSPVLVPQPAPFFIDVAETPEEVFTLALGRLPDRLEKK